MARRKRALFAEFLARRLPPDRPGAAVKGAVGVPCIERGGLLWRAREQQLKGRLAC
jgi:hypothetical protein